jgi:hypothetical protein
MDAHRGVLGRAHRMTETKAKPKRRAPVPKHKRENCHYWNYRVVRRHKTMFKHTFVWLEITEVHYKNGQPFAFALKMGAPNADISSDIMTLSEPEGIAALRNTLHMMQTALSQPILDEIEDFRPASKEIKK